MDCQTCLLLRVRLDEANDNELIKNRPSKIQIPIQVFKKEVVHIKESPSLACSKIASMEFVKRGLDTHAQLVNNRRLNARESSHDASAV